MPFAPLARGDWDARSDVDLLAVTRAVVGFADQQLGELAGPQAT